MAPSTDDVVELVASVPSVLEESAIAAMMQAGLGVTGFEIRDQGSFKKSAPGRVELVLYTLNSLLPALVRDVEQALQAVGKHVLISTAPAPEASWRDKWMEYFKVAYITSRIVIVPSWEKHDATTAEIVLNLDPGRAFGTGQHESTRLLLKGIDALETRGFQPRRILDVGCGSGILTIAALKLWPESRAVVCDTDEDSVRIALENLERNGLAERVRGELRPLAKIPGQFDLVLANIQLDVLETLTPSLTRHTAEGGVLALSGLLKGQDASIIPMLELVAPRAFHAWGRGAENDWIALLMYHATPAQRRKR